MAESHPLACIKCDGTIYDYAGCCRGCGRRASWHKEGTDMAVHPNGTGDQLVGTVEAVNDRGIKINGQWENFSKFAPDLVPPERGQAVSVTLDKSGFVRAIEPAEPTQAQEGPSASRETTITRLAVLKAAAVFCAARPELKSSGLLALAERMEGWVTRD